MACGHLSPSNHLISFLILGLHVRVDCPNPALQDLLVANFGGMASADEESPADLEYSVQSNEPGPSFSVIRERQSVLDGCGASDFLYLLEKDITVELQKRRSDLFFLHAAALDWKGKACLLAADSGRGKSTTTWGLLHCGFAYLTDELSPIDLDSMQVFPYPHALCLKRLPPAYPLPAEAIHLGRTIHVPTPSLPSATISAPRPLGAVFLVDYRPALKQPTLRAISPAEAGARLYVTALNALAHAHHGLDAVVRIAEHVPCFAVSSAELPATCTLIRHAAERVFAGCSAAAV